MERKVWIRRNRKRCFKVNGLYQRRKKKGAIKRNANSMFLCIVYWEEITLHSGRIYDGYPSIVSV